MNKDFCCSFGSDYPKHTFRCLTLKGKATSSLTLAVVSLVDLLFDCCLEGFSFVSLRKVQSNSAVLCNAANPHNTEREQRLNKLTTNVGVTDSTSTNKHVLTSAAKVWKYGCGQV